MTRKDFELIARAIAAAREETQNFDGLVALDRAARLLADELKVTNPRFDSERFVAACVK